MASRGPPPGMGPIMVLSKSQSSIFIFNADNLIFCSWLCGWSHRHSAAGWHSCVINFAQAALFACRSSSSLCLQWYLHGWNTLVLTFPHTFSISCFIHPDSKTQRSQGRQAQLGNINAARAVADIIRSTLGPRSMLKVRITMTIV